MKVFFTTTPRFKVDYAENVQAIYKAIEALGHKHMSNFLLRVDVKEFYTFNDEHLPNYYEEILESLRKADVVVIETSLPSIGEGMLLREALAQGKGVIALHIKGKFPFFIGGLREDKLIIEEYDVDNVRQLLQASFEYLSEQTDTRFNFFIAPKHQHYLDWISRHQKTPRAVHLRWLLERDMAANKAYQADLGKQKQAEVGVSEGSSSGRHKV